MAVRGLDSPVPQVLGPGDVGADEVALHDDPGDAARDRNAGTAVAGDDVAGAGGAAADGAAGGVRVADAAAAQGVRARGVGPDQVALDRAVVAAIEEDHIRAPVSGDDVARGRSRRRGQPADLGPRLAAHVDAGVLVSQGRRAEGVGADVVPLDEVAAVVHQNAAAVGRDDVAGPGAIAADRGLVGTDLDALIAVAQGPVARGINADEVAGDDVAQRAVGAVVGSQTDAVQVVAGDEVALAGRGAADGVVSRIEDVHAVQLVAQVGQPAGICSDKVALNDVAAAQVEFDPVAARVMTVIGEAVDHQAAHPAATHRDDEAMGGTGHAAVEDDAQVGVVGVGQGVPAAARLAVTVDDDGVGDRRQAGGGLDLPRPRTRVVMQVGGGDVELDRVQAGMGRGVVGVEDGLAERAGAAVVGVQDCEGGREAACL